MTKTKEERLEERVASELTPLDMDERYREMLDECYSFASVGGMFAHMSPAKVLEEMDPTAYRCGFNDWIDGEEKDDRIEEVNGEYYDPSDLRKLEEEISDEMDAEEESAKESTGEK